MYAEWALVIVTLVYAIATIALVVVLIWAGKTALKQLRLSRSDSLRKLVMDLVAEWTSDRLQKAINLLRKELTLGPPEKVDFEATGEQLKQKLFEFERQNKSEFAELLLIPHFFEKMSVVLQPHERTTDETKKIMKLFCATINFYYQLYEAWITERRTKIKKLYIEFEELRKLAKEELKKE